MMVIIDIVGHSRSDAKGKALNTTTRSPLCLTWPRRLHHRDRTKVAGGQGSDTAI